MRTISRPRTLLAALAVAALVLSGCGDDDDQGAAAAEDRPTVVVTTSILADVVANVAGDQVDVVTIMPAGADPHTFQASAQQANEVRRAEVLIVNGGGFEEGLLDLIEAAESDGVVVHEALSSVEPLEVDDHADDDDHGHDDEDDHAGEVDHADEDGHDGEDGHAEDDDHGHDEGVDPHFFTDPARMAAAAEGIAGFLSEEVEGIDAGALRQAADAYVAELEALDAEIESLVAPIPEPDRVLVTNHEVFGYFADRYGFEVVGTVVPSGTTEGGSAGDLARLARVVRERQVPAIFTDDSTADTLARTLADEVGGVEVVALLSESLGPEGSGGETYVAMMRTNAERIAAALGGTAP